jgi:uncharacterized protein (TIGR02246 family)
MTQSVFEDIVAMLALAWNEGDSAAWAACFTEDADFIHILGGHGVGRPAIEAAHRALFDSIYRGSEVSFRLEKVKSLASNVVALLLWQRLAFTKEGAAAAIECRPTLILRHEPAGWRIALMHNTRIAGAGTPDQDDRLLASHPHRPG